MGAFKLLALPPLLIWFFTITSGFLRRWSWLLYELLGYRLYFGCLPWRDLVIAKNFNEHI